MQYQGCSLLSALMTKKHRRVRARLGTAASALELVLDCRAVRRPAPHPSPRGRYRAPARPQRLKNPRGRATKKKKKKSLEILALPSHTPTQACTRWACPPCRAFRQCRSRRRRPKSHLRIDGGEGGGRRPAPRIWSTSACTCVAGFKSNTFSAVQRPWLLLGIVVTWQPHGSQRVVVAREFRVVD